MAVSVNFDDLINIPNNRKCADCNTQLIFDKSQLDNPWASINICVFVCTNCCGVHRSMGVHISAMKSCKYDVDVFNEDVILQFLEKGNMNVNNEFESYMPVFHIHLRESPLSTRLREWFIPAKYSSKIFTQEKLIYREMPQPVMHQKFVWLNPEESSEASSPSTPRSGATTGKTIWVEFSQHFINFYKNVPDARALDTIRNIGDLHSTDGIIIEQYNNSISLTVGNYVLYHDDLNILIEWCHALRAAALYYATLEIPQLSPDTRLQVNIMEGTNLGYAKKQPGGQKMFSAFKRWDNRLWIVGEDDVLYYFKKPSEGQTELNPQGAIPLQNAEIIVPVKERTTSSNCLQICTPERGYVIQLPGKEQTTRFKEFIDNTVRRLHPHQIVNFATENLSSVAL